MPREVDQGGYEDWEHLTTQMSAAERRRWREDPDGLRRLVPDASDEAIAGILELAWREIDGEPN